MMCWVTCASDSAPLDETNALQSTQCSRESTHAVVPVAVSGFPCPAQEQPTEVVGVTRVVRSFFRPAVDEDGFDHVLIVRVVRRCRQGRAGWRSGRRDSAGSRSRYPPSGKAPRGRGTLGWTSVAALSAATSALDCAMSTLPVRAGCRARRIGRATLDVTLNYIAVLYAYRVRDGQCQTQLLQRCPNICFMSCSGKSVARYLFKALWENSDQCG